MFLLLFFVIVVLFLIIIIFIVIFFLLVFILFERYILMVHIMLSLLLNCLTKLIHVMGRRLEFNPRREFYLHWVI